MCLISESMVASYTLPMFVSPDKLSVALPSSSLKNLARS